MVNQLHDLDSFWLRKRGVRESIVVFPDSIICDYDMLARARKWNPSAEYSRPSTVLILLLD